MKTRFLILLLLCGFSFSAYSVDVHKWVDENGITHYSDEKPNSSTIDTTVIEVPANYVTASQENYYSVVKQWERLHQERLAFKQLKLEQAKLEVSNNIEPVPVVVNVESDRKTYVPAYPHRFAKHFHKSQPQNIKDFKFAPDHHGKLRSKSRRNHPREDFIGLRLRIK